MAHGAADEFRSALGLFEDLEQVLSEGSDGQQVEAAEERDEHEDARDTVRALGVTHELDELTDAGDDRERGQAEREVAHHLERREAEREYPLLRPPQVRRPRVRGATED